MAGEKETLSLHDNRTSIASINACIIISGYIFGAQDLNGKEANLPNDDYLLRFWCRELNFQRNFQFKFMSLIGLDILSGVLVVNTSQRLLMQKAFAAWINMKFVKVVFNDSSVI